MCRRNSSAWKHPIQHTWNVLAACVAAVPALALLSLSPLNAHGQGQVPGQQVPPQFYDPMFFSVGDGSAPAYGLAVADVTENGHPDVAISNFKGTVTIYPNSGDWSDPQQGFGTPTILSVGDEWAALGELQFAHLNPDTDDNLDLVVVEAAEEGGASRFFVFMSKFEGDPGEFDPPVAYDLSYKVKGLVVADLDNDGYSDIALAPCYNQFGPREDKVLIRWNNRLGVFLDEDEQSIELGLGDNQPPFDLVVGHFDKRPGLQYLDLVTSNSGDPDHHSISTIINLGNRQFLVETSQKPDGCSTDWWTYTSITSGRFQLGKTFHDLACSPTAPAEAAIFHGLGQGTFEHDCSTEERDKYQLNPGPPCVKGAHNGHLNGGTNLDVAFALSTESQVSVLLGRGDGTFQIDETGPGDPHGYIYDIGANKAPYDVRIVDLDQDGFGDMVTANMDGCDMTVLINRMEIVIVP